MANERNAGAKKKFPLIETKYMQIKRIVPEKHHNEWKQKVNQFINQLQEDYERL
jgi:hypothetical protein